MEREFLTWGNLIVWAVCSILLYLSLNFRLYMIFHHPGRKLRERSARRKARDGTRMRRRPIEKALNS
ncbi:MAG: hypothetical protein MUC41_05010 [Syntrophobacteraceae bacterium]|jgi:hypothetical protein|nr:hypothetical protein [Syntrophobacteraceae bacterium]